MKTKAEHELEQMLVGAQREEENLRDYITEICSIIYMECPLEYQDAWVKNIMELGYFKPDKAMLQAPDTPEEGSI